MAKSNSICSIPDCGKKARTKGLCPNHYYRLWKHGDPLAGRVSPGDPLLFIEEVATRHEGDECLIWPFARDTGGYGRIQIDGRLEAAHRYVCKLANGEPPAPEHEAAHSCGNGHLGCVTKRHLSWKTPKENQADRILHGTDGRGERCATSRLKKSEVIEIRALQGIQTQSQIGAKFGISREHVRDIHKRRRWAWLSPE